MHGPEYAGDNVMVSNTPFDDLSPLAYYLDSLREVTLNPDDDAIKQLYEADKLLTDRAVLLRVNTFIHGEGWRTFGYRSYMTSGGLLSAARFADIEPGSKRFMEVYDAIYSIQRGVDMSFDEYGVPVVNIEKSRVPPDMVDTNIGSLESRLVAARAAMITLGGHLAVSGAFYPHDIRPAYMKLRGSLEDLGMHSNDKDYVSFGTRMISRRLFEQMWRVRCIGAKENPIGGREAAANINEAWKVVGRPYGVFSNILPYPKN